jgi:hypothetical protein
VKKKMMQIYEKGLEIESPKFEVKIPEENKDDQLLGDLNPRYFEEAMNPENSLDRVYASKVHNHLIRPF